MAEAEQSRSYSQILRSSSIIGGAQAINFIVSLVKTKAVAVLLGPSGVGLVGLYVTTVGMVETLAGMGIRSSGVRDIAEANASSDPMRLAVALKALRRACWLTGLFGWLLMLALAYPLSTWVFQSAEHAGALALLGSTLLVGSISGGQVALVQGVRRIGDLARLNLLAVLAGTVIAIPLYYWLGEQGIVPVLIISAFANAFFSWWFARQIQVAEVSQTLLQSFHEMRGLFTLGLAFMWSGLLGAGVSLVIRAIIQRELGLEANGLYQAAWAISGMFAGFILAAMGADFYPRLTSAKGDFNRMRQLVNEQTEIGILLALPGLVGTLCFAPWIIHLLYSEEFVAAADLLPWFVLGVFGRVVSWPLGFIMLALGQGGWFAVSETVSVVSHALLALLFIGLLGLVGSAFAFAMLYVLNTVIVWAIALHLIRFYWSRGVCLLLALSTAFVLAGFILAQVSRTGGPITAAFGAVLTLAATGITFFGLVRRLGPDHRFTRVLTKLPFVGLLCRPAR